MGKISTILGLVPRSVGPLFAKELLVASRRPRYYVLRFAYLAVLALFVGLVWLGLVESAREASGAYRIGRLSQMGRDVTQWIVWFQFIAMQVVTVFLLSGAVGEEVYGRTLVPLLTTPIEYRQIVLGKFLGKLLHVGLLLAVSLPLLAIVRLTGGVPWDYLAGGVCTTMVAAALTGSVALHSSIMDRPGRMNLLLSVLRSIALLVVLYAMLSAAGVALWFVASPVLRGGQGVCFLLYTNPVAALLHQTVVLHDPSARVAGFYWPIHCGLMVGVTAIVLKLCGILARGTLLDKAIAIHARPAATPSTAKRRWKWKPKGWALRRIGRSPILWREIRKPLLRDKVVQLVVTFGAMFYLLYTFAILGAVGAMGDGDTQAFFVTLFLLVAMGCTALDAATTIAPEKRARTFAGLLSTPMTDWQILLGKAGGTFLRCLPVWMFLLGYVLLFVLLLMLSPIALIHVVLLVAGTSVFLTGTGVYFSTRCRNAATASLMNVGLAAGLWGLAPALGGVLDAALGLRQIARILALINPVTQATVIARRAAVAGRGGVYFNWLGFQADGITTTLWLLLSTVFYCLLGLAFAWRAKKLFRRNAFES